MHTNKLFMHTKKLMQGSSPATSIHRNALKLLHFKAFLYLSVHTLVHVLVSEHEKPPLSGWLKIHSSPFLAMHS